MKNGVITGFPTHGFAKIKPGLFASQAMSLTRKWQGMFAALIVLSLVCVPTAYAQAPRPLPTVTKAADVFEAHPGTVMVESQIALTVKNRPSIRQLLRDGLQVRMFSLRRGESRPVPITNIDLCDVFLTTVLPVGSPRDLEATIPALGAGWLTLSNSEKFIEPGRYYLVFEKKGPTEQQFRLKHTDVSAYFDTGFALLVTANQRVSLKEVVDARYEQFDRDADLIRDINRKEKEPCYEYRRLSAEAEPDTQLAIIHMDFCGNVPPSSVEM